MKKRKLNNAEDYTFLQDIIDAYRYPDGTLNKIAIFISSLALVLLLIAGHFVIQGISNIKNSSKVTTVVASELNVDEISDYITDSYLQAISGYSKGNINQEAAKKKLLNFLAEYINSDDGFTSEQKSALNNILNEYVNSTNIYKDMAKNKDNIETLTTMINNLKVEDKEYVDQLIKLLEKELADNGAMDDEKRTELTNKIVALRNEIIPITDELKSNQQKSEAEIKSLIEQQGKDFQKQIDDINGKLTNNDKYFQFGYDPETGCYGYQVNGEFKPW